jgi:predicted PurR-regulated permease PerM
LKDGPGLMKSINKYLSMKKQHHQKIIKRLDDVMFGVVYGNVLVALFQGIVAIIGFFIFGVNAPILWGLVVAITALIPYIGTALVWVPMSLIFFLEGFLSGDKLIMWKGVGLFLYGLLLISTIDNFLKPKIIGDRSKVHPVVILLGIFGGLALMGIPGFIVGPVVLALTISFVEIYLKK